MLVDYHLHLRAPGGGAEQPDQRVDAVERYVARAVERGVGEIGVSEHVYYFRQTEAIWDVSDQQAWCRYDLDEYCGAIVEAKRQGLPVKLGLEVDWVPGRADELAEILAPYPWDYLLGSVHWIDGLAVDSRPGLWEKHSPEEVWALYARELEAAARSGHFDVLSHPDLVKIFGDRVEWDWQPVSTPLTGSRSRCRRPGCTSPSTSCTRTRPCCAERAGSRSRPTRTWPRTSGATSTRRSSTPAQRGSTQ